MKKNLTIKELGKLHKKICTDEVVRKLEDGLKRDWTIGESCRQAGISERTYENYCNISQEFAEKMALAKDFAALMAKNVFVSALNDNTVPKVERARLAMEWLKRRRKELYSERQETDLTSGGDKINFGLKDMLK